MDPRAGVRPRRQCGDGGRMSEVLASLSKMGFQPELIEAFLPKALEVCQESSSSRTGRTSLGQPPRAHPHERLGSEVKRMRRPVDRGLDLAGGGSQPMIITPLWAGRPLMSAR